MSIYIYIYMFIYIYIYNIIYDMYRNASIYIYKLCYIHMNVHIFTYTYTYISYHIISYHITIYKYIREVSHHFHGLSGEVPARPLARWTRTQNAWCKMPCRTLGRWQHNAFYHPWFCVARIFNKR